MPPDPDRRARGGRDHLSTAHLLADLIPRSLRGGAITMAGQVVKVAAQVAAIVILARLLAPWDFGLFAMVAVFLTILELFKDLGLSTATVQRPEITSRQVSTLFWLNTALGALMACLLAALGPALAWFYDEPVLIDVALALTVTFLLTGLAAQHLALLRRQMRFVSVTAVQVGSELLALVAAVVAAYADFGIWALVAQRLVWAAAVAAGAWAFCSWRPGLPGPFAEVRALVAFGGNTTASMTIGYAASNLDKVLIGWYWGATPLGLFERTQKLVLLPVLNLNVPLATVALSALSRLTGDPERYRRAYVFAVERLALLLAPAGGLLVAGAGPVVAAVFGEKWTDAVPILAWLGAAMFFLPVIYALSWLYMSQDRTGEMLRASAIGGGMTVAAVLCGLPFGPVAVAAAYTISGIAVRVPVLFWLAGRQGPVGMRDLGGLLVAPATAEAAAAGAVWLARLWTDGEVSPVVELIALAATAYAVGLAVYAAFPRGRSALRGLARLRLSAGTRGGAAPTAPPAGSARSRSLP